jgi:PfaB family protein
MHHDQSVAIVGIGGIFPDAPDLDHFWDNIIHGRSATCEVPPGTWPISAQTAFASETAAADHVYSLRGCFINHIPSQANLSDLNIDQSLLKELDPLFHLLLHAGKQAFDDARTDLLDRSRVGVIIGNLALPSEKSALLARQWLGRTFEEKLLGRSHERLTAEPLNRYVAGLPAGVLAQALGIGGGSFTLDAACASSLYAIKLAADELLSGRADAMLTGGLSRPDPLYTQMGFSQLRALSRRGICSPFDASGDGLVVGEGSGVFLLKRTEDALAHGDRIYGIIKGIGLSNDVGGSLLAPLSEGQLRAMQGAYARTGWQPQDVDLIECHATGTPVGDAVEVASLKTLWGNSRNGESSCVIGSVKSNIGHLLTAAGSAAMAKVIMAMAKGVLPPTANYKSPSPGTNLDDSPFRVLTQGIPWLRRGEGIPRRAAISAFGFGGINAHLLLEEWLPKVPKKPTRGKITKKPHQRTPIAVIGMDARFGPWQSLRSFQERVLGGDTNREPTTPKKWWGAEKCNWYREKGLHHTPFTGYFIDEATVATDQFRIPPKEMEEMLPQQLLMLQSAASAVADAGLGRDGNEQAGVFIGIALDLNSTNFSYRWSLAEQSGSWGNELGTELDPEELAEWTAALRDAAGPPLTANRTMGALGSVVASRIAREFRFGGPSFTISSEESSGIRALETAFRLLHTGEINRALVGAVDLAGDLRSVMGHHSRRPFSRSGRTMPFDRSADGSIIGEGAAAVVLKRLDDAERDGDRIYAVIRGIGSAGGNMLVPGEAAYLSALERAYDDAGVEPDSIGFLEAHGSGYPEEDQTEATALAAFFNPPQIEDPPRNQFNNGSDAPAVSHRRCAIASVKGDIGHSGAASGMASFVRSCLALYQDIIPPMRHVDNPLPELSAQGPFYFPRLPRFWLRNRVEGPRRAGLSVMGVDGTCSHVVLEGWEHVPRRAEYERLAPVGAGHEFLFAVTGEDRKELLHGLDLLRKTSASTGMALYSLAREWHVRMEASVRKSLAVALVARNHEELRALVDQGEQLLAEMGDQSPLPSHPSLRDRLFFSPEPMGKEGEIAFVFPGSGNHYPGMGIEYSSRWPEIFRNQDTVNHYLKGQFQPELFWNGATPAEINDNHRAVIFGQVATGCAVSDIVRSFGVQPQAVIGYSLGESAGLFALGAWRDRDKMLARMQTSNLFTRDLAGECRAACHAWGIAEGRGVEWGIGVVKAPAREVRRALRTMSRVYLLIINTPEECVIGGDAKGVRRLVATLGCRYYPLHGVTTVHCEVAKEVAEPYRDLHLFTTTPPPGITFYSGAQASSYELNRESAADSILAQAVSGIDFPALIKTAYDDGVRYFLEMGPGSSCSRMISRILVGRPHLARSACFHGQDPNSALLRLLAHLVAERIPVDLGPLYAAVPLEESAGKSASADRAVFHVVMGGKPFTPPSPPRKPEPTKLEQAIPRQASSNMTISCDTIPLWQEVSTTGDLFQTSVITDFAATQAACLKAHEAYLRFSEEITRSMANAIKLQYTLQEALGGETIATFPVEAPQVETTVSTSYQQARQSRTLFDRNLCLEFARGSVAKMLGPAFAEADNFPTRVRLPDEPLMLVDRIVSLEGEAKSMTNGRVVTEHDIHTGAWYLDCGRIPTCIAVEAGQADLFLSGYLGIDFITKGMSVYRLLDAVVTFHRELPGPGETISYDIHIDRFFRQGETWLFRFRFEATVNGAPLLSMRDGCAGFFSAAELEAGKGIVRGAIDLRPRNGSRPDDWTDLVPMTRESYDATKLDCLRSGDLVGCFGPLFAGLELMAPLTIPSGQMHLVHRVMELVPEGGRYGLGFIRAEADIHPQDWFLTCHFVDDRVMPGTLMYECCLHTLRIFLLRTGWLAETGSAAWEPVPGVASRLICRGQVLETTRIAAYEVSIREVGFRPEPYAIVDALMYADGRPIVEITSMSVRLTGTDRHKLTDLWSSKSNKALTDSFGLIKPAIYTKEQILAYSNGNPSKGFGELYQVFDKDRKIARLPGPPFQFMDRVTAVRGEPWQMKAGAMAEAQYDLPADAWFFAAERQPRMPFAVLLETALQPCGWLAAYVGSALTSPIDLSFRNLGGDAVQHRPVSPESGTLTATAALKKVATSGGMIIQEYEFTVADSLGTFYEGNTMFGFFSGEALANQVGVRDASTYQPSQGELDRARDLDYPIVTPFPDRTLQMIDRIEMYVPDGGPAGMGFIQGIKHVDPDEWFFKAHFYQDPVTPGSLGLESFLQLVKYVALDRWGWQEGDIVAVALNRRHRWLYRGQVVPANRKVTVQALITAADDGKKTLTADGFLSVDGRLIYQMNDFTVQLEQKQ